MSSTTVPSIVTRLFSRGALAMLSALFVFAGVGAPAVAGAYDYYDDAGQRDPAFLITEKTPNPSVSATSQNLVRSTVPVAEGGTVEAREVSLSASVSSSLGGRVRAEFQVLPASVAFTAGDATTGVTASEWVTGSGLATATVAGLADGEWHWRVRAVDETGLTSPWVQLGQAGNVDFVVSYVRRVKVAVVFVKLQGQSSQTDPIVTPCKLPGYAEHTFTQRDQSYYNDLARCTEQYFADNSYGRIATPFSFPLGYAPLEIGPDGNGAIRDEAYFGGKSTSYPRLVALADKLKYDYNVQLNGYDVMLIVHSGTAAQNPRVPISSGNSVIWNQTFQSGATSVVSGDAPVGVIAHELTHAVGGHVSLKGLAPDLYPITGLQTSRVGRWDVMGAGDWEDNIFHGTDWFTDTRNGTAPTLMSSYTRIFLGWLKEERHPKGPYETTWVEPLENSNYGGSVLRYDLRAEGPTSPPDYYLIEARKSDQTTWNGSLPNEGRVVLYHVTTSTRLLSSDTYNVNIPGMIKGRESSEVSGTLHVGQKYDDMNNMVRFIAEQQSQPGSPYAIKVGMGEIETQSIGNFVYGVVFRPKNDLQAATQQNQNVLYGVSAPKTTERGLQYGGVATETWLTTTLNNIQASWIVAAYLAVFWLLVFAIRRHMRKTANKSAYRSQLMWLSFFLSFVAVLTYSPIIPKNILWPILPMIAVATWVTFGVSNKVFDAQKTATLLRVVQWVTIAMTIAMAFFITLMTISYHRMGAGATNVIESTCIGNQCPSYGEKSDEFAGSDLHLSCPDGRHVGLNYETGEFESQVEGAIVSGPMGGAPEWIYVPSVPGNAGCRHYVSSRRVQDWLAAHPAEAALIPDATETYELYARTIDPAAGIMTSATVAGSIEPGEEVPYAITVAADGMPTVEEAPADGASVTVTGY
jgi:M6 family metalloprotease-like protein